MTTTDPLDLDVSHGTSHAAVITVRGEIDMSTSEPLRDQLIPAVKQGTVVLDLAGVEFCDSAGLRVLVEAHHTAHANGGTFRLAAASQAIMCVIELAGAVEIFELFPDVETALKD